MQERKLIKLKLQKTTTIEILEELREDTTAAFYSIIIINGILSVGDKISYKNDIGEVTNYQEQYDTYEIKINSNGAIANSFGNIITVTISKE